jgi:hypothetical protein
MTLEEVTLTDVNGDGHTHLKGTVLSDWEVSDHVKGKVKEGSLHYRALLEPMTEDEARYHRSKMTAVEGDHMVDGKSVSPPWDDYCGLHPKEIIDRMSKSRSRDEVDRVKLYERGGQQRKAILDYMAPVERPPFHGYDEMPVQQVLDKLEVLSPQAQSEVIAYETAHRRRPAIITWEVAQDTPEDASEAAPPENPDPEVTA